MAPLAAGRLIKPVLLAVETVDPDGALPRWLTPDVARLGWQCHILPGQEAIHLLGPDGWCALVLQVVRELSPAVLLVHPPYDHLDRVTCEAISATGTTIVGLGFDDPVFLPQWSDAALADMATRFDVWATTTRHARTAAAGARYIPWALAPEASHPVDDTAPTHEVVLVGRWTPERAAVVEAIVAAGFEVGAYGAGWPGGVVTRARMLGLFAKAGTVISPSDGRDMVKARVLEVAAVGGTQLVEAATDLADYAPVATYTTPADCVARLKSGRPLPKWTEVPGWTQRWSQLVPPLPNKPKGAESSETLLRLYSTLGHVAEQQGALRRATALFEHAGSGPAALAGQARCAHAMARWPEAAELARRAIQAHRTPIAQQDLVAFVPSHGQGTGLGRTGALDPTVELRAIRLHALARAGRATQAAAEVSSLPEKQRQAAAAVLQPDEEPTHRPLWQALGHKAPP